MALIFTSGEPNEDGDLPYWDVKGDLADMAALLHSDLAAEAGFIHAMDRVTDSRYLINVAHIHSIREGK